jgi:hypothetical protein
LIQLNMWMLNERYPSALHQPPFQLPVIIIILKKKKGKNSI